MTAILLCNVTMSVCNLYRVIHTKSWAFQSYFIYEEVTINLHYDAFCIHIHVYSTLHTGNKCVFENKHQLILSAIHASRHKRHFFTFTMADSPKLTYTLSPANTFVSRPSSFSCNTVCYRYWFLPCLSEQAIFMCHNTAWFMKILYHDGTVPGSI